MEIYALKDEKADCFLQPIPAQNSAQIQRQIGMQAMNPDGMMFVYPEDFTLYRLGSFEEKTGRFNQMETPELVCSVKSLQKKEFMEMAKAELQERKSK